MAVMEKPRVIAIEKIIKNQVIQANNLKVKLTIRIILVWIAICDKEELQITNWLILKPAIIIR